MDGILQGLYDSQVADMSVTDFLICIGTSLIIGIILAFVYAYKSRYTKSFIITLIMLPAIVAVVIIMVNGNIGAGIAVAGAFSLVRFRSIPGTAKDIATIFLAMGAGLICGMGFLAYSIIFTVIMGVVMMIIMKADSIIHRNSNRERTMKITVPEDLDYTCMFDDIFEQYTSYNELVSLKTTAMGSLFKLTYNVTLRDPAEEKEFIDNIRMRNGNLEINMNRQREVNANAL